MTATRTEDCRELFEAAQRELRTERRRVVDEREAFRAFEQHIRTLDGQGAPRQTDRTTQLAVRSTSQGLRTVRNAYESTVMAVPHYEEEYDESFEEHVTGEFGPAIGTLLTQGTVLNTQSKQTVLAAAISAQERRDALLDALDAEEESFGPASREVLSVVEELEEYEEAQFSTASFGTLDAYRLRLTVLKDQCTDLVERRQEALVTQRKTLSLSSDRPDVPTYLYQSLDPTYPLVSTATATIDRIEQYLDAVEQALIYGE